jgi:DNA-binding MarR family transcriptional regulator
MATASPQITEIQQQLFQTLTRANGRIQNQLEKALQEADLPPLAWFDVLHPISQNPDQALRPRDLGCGVQISRSGLTRLLDRMEDAGVIERKRCDIDRRGSYIALTEPGVQMAAAMGEIVEAELAQAFSDLYTEEEAAQLSGLLGRVLE